MFKTAILQELAESQRESEGSYVNSDASEEADSEELFTRYYNPLQGFCSSLAHEGKDNLTVFILSGSTHKTTCSPSLFSSKKA